MSTYVGTAREEFWIRGARGSGMRMSLYNKLVHRRGMNGDRCVPQRASVEPL